MKIITNQAASAETKHTIWNVCFWTSSLSLLLFAFSLKQSFAATPVPESRFTPEENNFLKAASDVYFYHNRLQDFDARLAVLEKFLDNQDPTLRNVADAAISFIEANEAAAKGPNQQQDMLETFSRDWKNFVSQTIGEAIISSIQGKTGVNSPDLTRQAEQLMAGPQNQAIWDRSMLCLVLGLHKNMRAKVTTLMESRHAGRPQATGAMHIQVRVKDDMIWMTVTNKTIRPFHNCLITSRREQDAAKVDEQKKHSVIAQGLGEIFGMSKEANARNILQGDLLLETQKVEHGSLIFMAELNPNESVTFPMSTDSHLEYTTGIFVSLWCDEGKELNAPVSVSGLKIKKD